jgi:hypothetical protein
MSPDMSTSPSSLAIIRSCADADLHSLLLRGLEALQQENESLAAAFQPPQQPPRSFYKETNQSLAYWVFETTLVYILFKAWLPSERVRWEDGYPGSRKNKADLVIFRDDNNPKARWVFEAKWWLIMSDKMLRFIRADLEKLLRWRDTDGRVLLAFWYSPQHRRQKDLNEVDLFCHNPIGSVQPRCVFAGEFPIHTKWTKHDWNFTMVAIQLHKAPPKLRSPV